MANIPFADIADTLNRRLDKAAQHRRQSNGAARNALRSQASGCFSRGLAQLGRTVLLLLPMGAAIMIATAVVAIAKRERCEIATCGRQCWWDGRRHRCRTRCVERCRRPSPSAVEQYVPDPEYDGPERVRSPPGPERSSHDVEVFLRIELIGGGLLGILVGGLSLIVRAIRRARLRRQIRISINRLRRAEELHRRVIVLAREADDILAQSRAEAFRRCDEV